MSPASALMETFLFLAVALSSSNCCPCTVMLVILIRMAFVGLLTVLSLVYSTYAADRTRQSSMLNSSMFQRLEAESSHNTFDLPINGSRSTGSPLVSSALLASNISADPHQPSSGYQLLPDVNTEPYCRKDFGKDLNIQSCRSALSSIELSDQVHRVAKRSSGYRAGGYLPFRWLSREYSPTNGVIGKGRSLKSSICGHLVDGTCAIDVVLGHNSEEDAVSSLQLFNAADALFRRCVLSNTRPVGGQLINVGKSESLETKT